jgi:transcriptional regulator with XRE-family HTH domain
MWGLSVRELAARAGCSPSFVSRIENGTSKPSLTTLHNLVRVLDANVASLFDDAPGSEEGVARPGERPQLAVDPLRTGAGIVLERLIPYAEGHLLQANIHIIEADGETDGAIAHPGEELGYVLEGQLDLWLDGQCRRLTGGDSFYFDSLRPHGYRNPGPGRTRVLWVNTPPTF